MRQPPRATILVIDGDDIAGAMMADMLDVEGYRVLTAWNTRQGLAHLERERVQLIICEAMLLYVTGLELRDRLLEHPDFGAIPFILTSVYPEPPSDARRYHAFLAKPFHFDAFLTLVVSALHDERGCDHPPDEIAVVRSGQSMARNAATTAGSKWLPAPAARCSRTRCSGHPAR
jgi:CheY-like chemotaxis protein